MHELVPFTNKSSQLLMCPPADAEELQFPCSIANEVSQHVPVWLVQPDDFIGCIEGKTHARHGGSWRRIRPGKAPEWDMVIDEMFSLYFEVETFSTDLVSTDIFLELGCGFLNGFREPGFGIEIQLQRVIYDPCRNDPAVIAVGQDGEREAPFWDE